MTSKVRKNSKNKSSNPRRREENERKDVSSEDIPGDGTAKKAGQAIEDRQNRRKEVMSDLFGKDRK